MNITQINFFDCHDDFLFNTIMDSDSYKTSHWRLYPPDTECVYSYLESRGGLFDRQVMFGLQYILKRYFVGVVVTHQHIDMAKAIINEHMGGNPDLFNEAGWRYIVDQHGGRLPLEIRALPEGTQVPAHVPLVTVHSTDPKCDWLVNYMETNLMRVWYPITVASLSHNIRRVILGYLEKTGTPEDIDFKLQDFGSRGSTSRESAAIGGAAHMVSFKGSDTMVALMMLYKYYGATGMPAFSVPAGEHSTYTSWGRENESAAYKNMLEQYPTGIVSIVSDSYDIFNACGEIYGRELRSLIVNREGVLVVRPDSGDIIPTVLRILEILAQSFGSSINSKGYRVLPSYIRVLQGDGMNIHTLTDLCEALTQAGWSTDNIACFGMGGKLLQGVDRDTLKFAFKCSAIQRSGKWHPVYKDPVTDPGKTSKQGILSVHDSSIGLVTRSRLTLDPVEGDLLQLVFRNGELCQEYTLEQIRKRANS